MSRPGSSGPSPASWEPSAVHELPIPDGRGLHVCFALPPRRVGRVRLDGWWPSFGAGLTLAEARGRARSEVIERASAVFQGDEPRIVSTYRELGKKAIHPNECLLVSARQRRRRSGPHSLLTAPPQAFDESAPIEWSPLRSLTHGRTAFFPTMSLYFKYLVRRSRRFCPADSNGLAAAPTRPDASLRALLELVERDSVALWWYNRVRRPALDVAGSSDPVLGRLLRFYAGLGREAWVLDLTSDLGIPVAVALSRRNDGREDLAFGFGAGVTRLHAARHALTEMAQVLATRHAGGRGGSGTGEFERWRRAARAGQYPYLLPSIMPALRVDGATMRPSAALHWCCRRLKRRGLEVFRADLTRPTAPLTVVRIIVPGLRHMWPRLAPGRLYDAPVAAGWRSRPLSEDKLNSVPLLL